MKPLEERRESPTSEPMEQRLPAEAEGDREQRLLPHRPAQTAPAPTDDIRAAEAAEPAPAAPQSPAVPNVQVTVSQNVNQQAADRTGGIGVLHRSWVVALVLAILLGWLGIDSFYLGQGGKGILKFFTVGLFGILWLVDIIMIATRSVRGIEWS